VAAVALLIQAPVAGAAGAAEAGASVGQVAAVQNQVETRRANETSWSASTLHQPLYGLDRVRTGAGSRAAIVYSDRTVQRLNEKSEIEIQAPGAGQPGVLKVLSGTAYFSSRAPKDYGRIETPTVTAAIKGTEFVVEVGADTTTTITMLEGVVEATNAQGSLTVTKGEQAFVEPGKAPVKRIVVHPRDAVAWALYYPPVLGGKDAQHLTEMGPDGESLSRAAQLLSTGNVAEARPLIDEVRAKNSKDPVALALASTVATSQDDRKEAMSLGEQAVAADPNSAAAALAVSYAAQAQFDIRRAREMAEKAAQLDPDSSVALARVAELRMAEGDIAGAESAAAAAVQKNPGDARAASVLGFVDLAQLKTAQAESRFEAAVASDQSLSMARLGLGIARIRRGRVADGRQELQVAASLDPDDSLLRSYLGKALYEEKLNDDAAKELATAKELDPLDPTPYLYDAIRKQNENRPVEALADLQASIARNDNRAVYRSRLLLDQDHAVRTSDLARIYNDLGFDQLGMVTARRSADEDQANYSSHLFLAGNYRNLPNFSTALFSEVLQARVYQPVSVNAVRPDVVNQTASYNEYTALFDRPRARAFASGIYGQTNTDLSELFGSNQFLIDTMSIDESGLWAVDATGTYNTDRIAAALSYRKLDDDGFRFNNDTTIANYRGFFEWAASYRDFLQVNILESHQKTGDLPLRGFPAIFASERFDSELSNYAVAYHHMFGARSDLVVSGIYNNTKQTGNTFFCQFGPSACVPVFSPFEGTTVLEGPQLEAQQVFRFDRMTLLAGLGAFRGETRIENNAGLPTLSSDDEFSNGYAYLTVRRFQPFEFTVGAAWEKVRAPLGVILPRDSQIAPADVTYDKSAVSPKVGVSVYLPTHTTLRAAWFKRLSPAIGRLQTLEPTQVSGFNQFLREPGGTNSNNYGGGIDQAIGTRAFAGFGVTKRDRDVPEGYCDAPDPFSGCAGRVATHVEVRTSEDVDANAYLNVVVMKWLALNFNYDYSKSTFDYTFVDQFGLFADRIMTRRFRSGARFFMPCGFFAYASATWYEQEEDKFDDMSSPDRSTTEGNFWLGEVTLGYKLPKRLGSIVLTGRNVSDREFEFYERAPEETIVPARQVTLAINFTY
jgi:Tfp pilus assembly protein PilF